MSSADDTNTLLSKPIQECAEFELVDLHNVVKEEMRRRAFASLELAAYQYTELYGNKEGMEELGEDLCRRIAPSKNTEGWANLVRHLVKISG